MKIERVSDEELLEIIKKNCEIMQEIINLEPSIINGDKSKINNIYIKNMDYYQEASRRKLKVPNINFMMAVATMLGYNYDEFLSNKKQKKLTKK